MTPAAAIITAAVIVFAIGFVALMLPRIHGAYYRPPSPAFVAMWTAAIVGSIEGGVLAFLVISLIGPGIGYAAALTLPRTAASTMEVLSFIGAGLLLALSLIG